MLPARGVAVVLKEGNTGVGFGVRGELYPEDDPVFLAAFRLGRPVKARTSDGGEPVPPAAPPCRSRGECRGAHFRATTERARQPWLSIAGRARLGGRHRHHVLSASQIIKDR